MGLFDKLKSVLGEATGGGNDSDAVYLDDFMKDGTISSDSLPMTKSYYCYGIDATAREIIIVEQVKKGFGTKNKLTKKIPLDEIAAFRAIELKNLSTVILYKSKLITRSGEQYNTSQSLPKAESPTRSGIRLEMDNACGVSTLIMSFLPLIDDDATKQWVNEVYELRGTGPVFDDEGNCDMDAYFQMHNEWFAHQNAEWQRRMREAAI